ncbi:cytosolic leucyl tRNA synthetase [Spiromyces aspiralis]|uniref:Cytosolic leucyl tRNA synthetase n=1 Tax=Spiromyces aspiralis TaxID=68401 RepID=A0ACC1HEB0_9FUNG|nr:cytosolic leucyl tRNA synthetase [Spiromyces aspiralis]
MNTYNEETRHQFERTLGWLNQWACARTYGLGSKVPFDEKFLIESLSDSTIYMTYYTIAHYLHSSLDGTKPGLFNIAPEEMDDAAWDYVLLGKELPTGHSAADRLPELRKSFLYWYPLDIRSSGKDLIQNHLTFFLYIHTALFPDNLPLSVRCNGHLLLNGEKMSKSTGNFMTLRECVCKYGADATRLSLADAGDGLDDANFEESTANATILRLYTLYEWITDAVKAIRGEHAPEVKVRPADSPLTLIDRIFKSEIERLSKETERAYDKMLYRDALKTGFYDFLAARDWYREVTSAEGMHPSLVGTYIERQILILAPITPHWAEKVWVEVLGKPESIMKATWPAKEIPGTFDLPLLAAGEYIRDVVKAIRDAEAQLLKKKGGKKNVKGPAGPEFDPKAPKELAVCVAADFPEWQTVAVDAVKENYDADSDKFDDAAIRAALGKKGLLKDKKVMPFVQEIKKRVVLLGPTVAFDRALPFNELEVLYTIQNYILNSIGYQKVHIIDLSSVNDGEKGLASMLVGSGNESQVDIVAKEAKRAIDLAVPGQPGFIIRNI